ncbi:hypothetical protein UlMin_033744 [Ulmus minor]
MLGRGKRKDDEGFALELITKNRRVAVKKWQGRIMVDIHEFTSRMANNALARKVLSLLSLFNLGFCFLGISLSMDQWNILRKHVDEIDKAVNDNS